jgi:hypothetical protein
MRVLVLWTVLLSVLAVDRSRAQETPNARLGLPESEAPCDDPGRLHLGEKWEASFERCAAAVDSLREVRGDDPALILAVLCCFLPEYTARYVFENYFWPDALYDPRLLVPGRMLLERAWDPWMEAAALASMAASARSWNWALACSLADRAYVVADSASLIDDALPVWNVIDFMESELAGELSVHQMHIGMALELYERQEGAYPAEGVLRDPVALWDALTPFMPRVVIADAGRYCRNPEGLDLRTNRMITTPGLRLDWSSPSGEPVSRPRLFTYRLREGPTFTVSSSRTEDAREPTSPENVMISYVYAHRTRDIDRYRELFDEGFRNHVVDPGEPPLDLEQELAATQGLFEHAASIQLSIRFRRAAPSTRVDYPAADGFWEVKAERCSLTVERESGAKPIRAVQDGMIFVLRRDPSAAPSRWRIVAQIPPA